MVLLLSWLAIWRLQVSEVPRSQDSVVCFARICFGRKTNLDRTVDDQSTRKAVSRGLMRKLESFKPIVFEYSLVGQWGVLGWHAAAFETVDNYDTFRSFCSPSSQGSSPLEMTISKPTRPYQTPPYT
jgi:hypothetical protein